MRVEFSGEMTGCHKKLHEMLSSLGFQVRDNAEYGPYKIDCYCNELYLGFEADGTPYHKFKKKDLKRDQTIFDAFGIKILRLSDKEISKTEQAKNKIMEFINGNTGIKS